jgi:hypothetical protein
MVALPWAGTEACPYPETSFGRKPIPLTSVLSLAGERMQNSLAPCGRGLGVRGLFKVRHSRQQIKF